MKDLRHSANPLCYGIVLRSPYSPLFDAGGTEGRFAASFIIQAFGLFKEEIPCLWLCFNKFELRDRAKSLQIDRQVSGVGWIVDLGKIEQSKDQPGEWLQ
jgi:hypothetical protein